MEYNNYVDQKKDLYTNFLNFIDCEISIDECFQDLISFIDLHKYQENVEEFKIILHLINQFGKNHHRNSLFLDKIDRIISYYEKYITRSFTNRELFDLFKKCPLILHFFILKNIITVDESMALFLSDNEIQNPIFVHRIYSRKYQINAEYEKIKHRDKMRNRPKYKYYFYPYIKSFLHEKERLEIEKKLLKSHQNIFDNFEENCRIGENDSYICQLIRQDSIVEFIKYINKANILLSSNINPSFFETNNFLMNKQTSLIEYAAFCGSIQIFQYCLQNNVDLEESLWMYAIHGNNPEIIHILERNEIKPNDNTFVECLNESIKCHHNDIANYIYDNLMDQEVKNNLKKEFFILRGFKFHNYEFFSNYSDFTEIFHWACLYDYFGIVDILLSTKKYNLHKKKILKLTFFYKVIFFIH